MTNNNNNNNNPTPEEPKEVPVSESAGAAEQKISSMPANELCKLKEEATEYKNKYLQLLADADNARKRLQKERSEITQYAIKNILLDFLHPIDHMENALKFTDQASEEVKHWAVGFVMILNQFKDVLANNGVRALESVGKEFDPHMHEAIEMVVTSLQPEGIVVEESSKGYMIGDKPLRPARVKVSKAPTQEQGEESKI